MEVKKVKSFDEFKIVMETNNDLQKSFKEDPVAAIKKYTQQNPLNTDKWIYRIIVIALSVTIIYQNGQEKTVPVLI